MRTVIFAVIAVLVATAVSSTQLYITAEEVNNKGYKFAEDTTVTAVIDYRMGGTEVIPVEVFNQVEGFDPKNSAVFTMKKVVGDTPMLHKASDDSRKLLLSGQYLDRDVMDVEVLVSRGGETVRSFEYDDCRITNHNVVTNHDSGDGWHDTGGFSIVDSFEFSCFGYSPESTEYDNMGGSPANAKTTSSKDLKDTSTWSDMMRPKQ